MPKLKQNAYDYLKENIEALRKQSGLYVYELYDVFGCQKTYDTKMDNPETIKLGEVERLMIKFGIYNKKPMEYLLTKHDWLPDWKELT